MRNISFALTEKQFLDGTKDVTRRLGWKNLKPGDRLMAVRKGMGLKPGEKVVRLGEIEVVSVSREPVGLIEESDVIREGFPDLKPSEFTAMFCQHMKCTEWEMVTRIEFKRIGGGS